MQSTVTSKHVLIGGGSGFVGRALTKALRARGDRVTWISRTPGENRLTWNEINTRGIPDCDVVINLAGKHILDMRRRWGAAYRDEVLRSRIETTQALVQAINDKACDAKESAPALFISTAGKCFYGSQAFQSNEEYFDLDERSEPVGVDYPARLVRLWEEAAADIDTQRVRHVKMRLGIVLDSHRDAANQSLAAALRPSQGIFPMLHAAFKRGFCVSMGSGVQPFPWVHVDDAVGIFLHAIDTAEMQGIFNVVAPGIVSNQQFTQLLADGVGRSVIGRIPEALIKAVVGLDRSTILLLGQRVKPTRTLESGYRFQYPDFPSCLENLLTIAGTAAATPDLVAAAAGSH